MALNKLVKRGGSYYQGYSLPVSSSVGDYVIDMTQTGAAAINSLSIAPDEYGVGDTYTISHLTTSGGDTVAILCRDIPNRGANVVFEPDLPALEEMRPNESLRLSYTNTASVALNVTVIVEYVGIKQLS